MIPLLTALLALLVGCALAHPRLNRLGRILGLAGILFLSNAVANLPFFSDDPGTWGRTFLTGMAQTGIVSIFLHVLPAALGCYVTLKLRRRRAAAANRSGDA